MAKFMILFNSPVSAKEQMNNATADQIKASQQEWTDWMEDAVKSIGFEWGLPMQAVARVNTTGITESPSQASGYCTVDGDKDTITKLFQTHPHLKIPGSTIDVLEMIPMSGI